MPFEKGKSGNVSGRPQGSKNKTTATIRQWLVELINANRQQLQDDLLQLEPKERLQIIEKFLPYIMPKAESADEVEGACYSKDDIEIEEPIFSIEKKVCKRWYE